VIVVGVDVGTPFPPLHSRPGFFNIRRLHALASADTPRGLLPFTYFPSHAHMPKDTSIKKILLIGSGPIVIGQGCEFDYSGVQACKALKEEGYTVILVNSNPATIMTDPEFAHGA